MASPNERAIEVACETIIRLLARNNGRYLRAAAHKEILLVWGVKDDPQNLIGHAARRLSRFQEIIYQLKDPRGEDQFYVFTDKGRLLLVNAAPTLPASLDPNEVPANGDYVEGGVEQVLVNRYERDPRARAVCIAKFGPICQICEFDFGCKYGPIGVGFIHVHHLKPETLRQPSYCVDPLTDLMPVCPNCHAMLHTSNPPLTPDEIRSRLKPKMQQ